MENARPPFVSEYLPQAEELLAMGALGEPLFSRGTYQFEVSNKGEKKAYPFIQMDDDGNVTDAFCSCKVSESRGGCPHLAAGYLKIFHGQARPLHVRFRKSLWNRLFQMAKKKFGDQPNTLKEVEGDGYLFISKAGEVLFKITPFSEQARLRLQEIIRDRPEETEETSIKFSNLPIHEIEAYRQGKISPMLDYELSFWSDLAKWFMFLQEEEEAYQIAFEGTPLPTKIVISFSQVSFFFLMNEANWIWIIPSLTTVKSPLQVFDEEDSSIEKIEYDERMHRLEIQRKISTEMDEGIFLGNWRYKEGKGFYRDHPNPFLTSNRIEKDRIALVLSHAASLIRKFIPVSETPRKCQYALYFDERHSLHIELYIEEPNDMKGERASCFFPWAYLPGKGFYLLEDWLFEEKEKVITKSEVPDFINHHKVWLHHFPGFQTHLGSLESHLTYSFTEKGELFFHAELNFPEDYEATYHFDEWVYIKGEGFYMKKESSSRLPIHPGLKIPIEEIPQFLLSHQEQLEQVQNFYTKANPIEKIGLEIGLNQEGLIHIIPKIEYARHIDPNLLKPFGNYYYLKGKGFFEVPFAQRIPERYIHETVISRSQEAAFLAYEFEPLKKYVLKMDSKLIAPQALKLKIRKIMPRRGRRGKEWLMELFYSSEIGTVDVITLWDAFQEKKRHLFSNAGLFNLKESRFNWIRHLAKKKIDRKKGLFRMSTLEWIRLSIFEDIEEPEDPKIRQFFEELRRLETDRTLDITRLKATLRPYQEEGLKWLWFLYSHGLSGLLCDDMGLGKTHQTMALLASVVNEDEDHENRYLVVCPTSVIYHWQELLRRFLPEIRVLTYYGVERSMEHFEECDLLLTSYGILRTGKESFKGHRFEVAIFDEIQIAKNHTSQTHKALRGIQATMKLGLTGTPIENRLQELKALMDLVLPSYLPPDAIFRELFINPIEKQQDPLQKELLSRLIRPFILRRKKTDVLRDLPEKIEEIAYSDLSLEQAKAYKEVAIQMKNSMFSDLKDLSKPISFVHVFSALSRLKQICDHPALLSDDVSNYYKHESGKWELFTELLNEALGSGQKVVVFSQYLEMLKIIELYLKKKGIGFAGIKGSTKNRPEQLRKFREDPHCNVFLASLLAAGVGIDLTTASIVIHYDRWWNPAKENQATDRVHRIGQNRGVQVFKLVTKNTIEEYIHEMIERKKGLLEEVIGVEDQINFLSREELIQVFEKIDSSL